MSWSTTDGAAAPCRETPRRTRPRAGRAAKRGVGVSVAGALGLAMLLVVAGCGSSATTSGTVTGAAAATTTATPSATTTSSSTTSASTSSIPVTTPAPLVTSGAALAVVARLFPIASAGDGAGQTTECEVNQAGGQTAPLDFTMCPATPRFIAAAQASAGALFLCRCMPSACCDTIGMVTPTVTSLTSTGATVRVAFSSGGEVDLVLVLRGGVLLLDDDLCSATATSTSIYQPGQVLCSGN